MPATPPTHLIYGNIFRFQGTLEAYKALQDELKKTFKKTNWESFPIDLPKKPGPEESLVVHFLWGQLRATTKSTAKEPARPSESVANLSRLSALGNEISNPEPVTGRALFLFGGPAVLRLVLPADGDLPTVMGPELARVGTSPSVSLVELGQDPLDTDEIQEALLAKAAAIDPSRKRSAALVIEPGSAEGSASRGSLAELLPQWEKAVPFKFRWRIDAKRLPSHVRRFHDAESSGGDAPMEFLTELVNLEELVVTRRSVLPEGIGALKKLKRLTLNCGLTQLPESFAQLESLEELNLDHNAFTEVPGALLRLPRLKTLTLWKSQVTSLPKALFQTGLRSLDLRSNPITSLPVEIGQSALRSLKLSGAGLESLPAEIGQMRELEELDLDSNKLQRLPDALGNAATLKSLTVRFNGLEALPEALGGLKALRLLAAEHNRLARLPDSLGRMEKLQDLYVQSNQLTELPASLTRLAMLELVNVDENQLTGLPEDLGSLQSLKRIHAAKNRLTSVPESLRQLTKLDTIDLSNNQLTQLPSLRHLNLHLTSIRLRGNPLVADLLDPPELRSRAGLPPAAPKA